MDGTGRKGFVSTERSNQRQTMTGLENLTRIRFFYLSQAIELHAGVACAVWEAPSPPPPCLALIDRCVPQSNA